MGKNHKKKQKQEVNQENAKLTKAMQLVEKIVDDPTVFHKPDENVAEQLKQTLAALYEAGAECMPCSSFSFSQSKSINELVIEELTSDQLWPQLFLLYSRDGFIDKLHSALATLGKQLKKNPNLSILPKEQPQPAKPKQQQQPQLPPPQPQQADSESDGDEVESDNASDAEVEATEDEKADAMLFAEDDFSEESDGEHEEDVAEASSATEAETENKGEDIHAFMSNMTSFLDEMEERELEEEFQKEQKREAKKRTKQAARDDFDEENEEDAGQDIASDEDEDDEEDDDEDGIDFEAVKNANRAVIDESDDDDLEEALAAEEKRLGLKAQGGNRKTPRMDIDEDEDEVAHQPQPKKAKRVHFSEEDEEEEDEEDAALPDDEQQHEQDDEQNEEDEDDYDMIFGNKLDTYRPPTKAEEQTLFEKENEKMLDRIEELERANLGPKPWQLSGEVFSGDRPRDSLLHEDVTFDVNAQAKPIITEEVTRTLEEIIISRIVANLFDDPVRLEADDKKTKRQIELESTKSNKSLAQIYEEEYLKQVEGVTNEEEDPKYEETKQQLEKRMRKVMHMLSSMSMFRHVPAPSEAEFGKNKSVASLTIEQDALPDTVAGTDLLSQTTTATNVAPEEIMPAIKTIKASKSEESKEDKKAKRRAVKERARKKSQKAAVFVDKMEINKIKKATELQTQLARRKALFGAGNKSVDFSNSRQFFEKVSDNLAKRGIKPELSKQEKAASKTKQWGADGAGTKKASSSSLKL